MKRYALSDWFGALAGVLCVVLWALYLFGPAGGSLMP